MIYSFSSIKHRLYVENFIIFLKLQEDQVNPLIHELSMIAEPIFAWPL